VSQRPGPYGHCAPFVTAICQVTFRQYIQWVSVNAGLCSRLCLNLFNHSETAVSQLIGRRPDVVIHVRNFESHVQFADQCAPVKVSSSAEYSVLQALQFQEVSIGQILPGGTGRSHY
jgi:hypothetical protein